MLTNSRDSVDFSAERKFDNNQSYIIKRTHRFHLVWLTYIQRLYLAFKEIDTGIPITVLASGKFSLWLTGIFSFFYPRHKYLAILHGSELNLSRWSRRLTRLSLRGFDRGIAVSGYTARIARNFQPRLKVTVIQNGFEPDRFEPYSGKKDLAGHPALITVGNVTRRKGQQNVIKALPTIRDRYPDVHYHIVGIPTEQAAFEALAKELEVMDHITFHGPLPDAELTAALRGADIFAMLSERQPDGDVEGFGIAILEANYLGLPAIGADDSGITDAIRDGYSGKLVNNGDPAAVSSAIEEIMRHYEAYAAQARSWSKDFTWEIKIKRYLELIENNEIQ